MKWSGLIAKKLKNYLFYEENNFVGLTLGWFDHCTIKSFQNKINFIGLTPGWECKGH
jgi:hypothetical protein